MLAEKVFVMNFNLEVCEMKNGKTYNFKPKQRLLFVTG